MSIEDYILKTQKLRDEIVKRSKIDLDKVQDLDGLHKQVLKDLGDIEEQERDIRTHFNNVKNLLDLLKSVKDTLSRHRVDVYREHHKGGF